MVYLFALFFDLLDIILNFYLFASTLKRIRIQKLAVKSPDLLCILEKLGIRLSELFFLDLLLILSLLLVNPPAFQLFLLELFESLFLLSFFEILEIV